MTHDRHRESFDALYRGQNEPWQYSRRGVELLRHQLIFEAVLQHHPISMLEIGCSLGLLTTRLTDVVPGLVAIDLAESAIRGARKKADASYAAASVLALPFAGGRFDFVLASDGPRSWFLNEAEKQQAYTEIARVLNVNGRALITEYLSPRGFEPFLKEIEMSPLRVESATCVHDRILYKLEKLLPDLLVRSRRFAAAVHSISRLAGKKTAHHLFVVARRSN